MRKEKTFRYYLYVYMLSLGGLFVYLVYQAWRNDGFDTTLISSLLWVPVFVTLFVFLIDRMTDTFKKKKTNDEQIARDQYNDHITQAIDDNHDLLFEEYRKLKESSRFQKGLTQAYQVLKNGENDRLSFEYILKKYPKQSTEFSVMLTVIEETRKMMNKQNQED